MFATVATELESPGRAYTPDHRPTATTSGGINGVIARIDAENAPKKPAPKRPTDAEWGDLFRTIRAVVHDPNPAPLAVTRDLDAFRTAVARHPKEPCIMLHASPRPMPSYMPGPEVVTLDWAAAAYIPHFSGSAKDGIWRLDSRSKGQTPIRVRVSAKGNRRDARQKAAKRAVATALALPERKIFDLLDRAAQHDRKIQNLENRAEKSRTIPIR